MRPFRVPHVVQDHELRQNFEELEDCSNNDAVIVLPNKPTDGQVVDYVADAANGVIWRLRYRAASTSTHKWEFVGGSALDSGLTGGVTTAVGSGTAEAIEMTGGPTITAPFTGDYDVTMSAFIQSQAAPPANLEVFLVKNKEGAVRVLMLLFVSTAQFAGAYVQRTVRQTLEAGKTYQTYCGSSAKISASYQSGRILVSPVRVG